MIIDDVHIRNNEASSKKALEVTKLKLDTIIMLEIYNTCIKIKKNSDTYFKICHKSDRLNKMGKRTE